MTSYPGQLGPLKGNANWPIEHVIGKLFPFDSTIGGLHVPGHQEYILFNQYREPGDSLQEARWVICPKETLLGL